MSQQDLAEQLKIDRSTISRWENDEMDITIGNAIKISNFFNIPMEEFTATDLEFSFAKKLQEALNLNYITPLQLANK